MVYVAVCPVCDAWCKVVADVPGEGALTMAVVAEWTSEGWTVKRVRQDEAAVHFAPCECGAIQPKQLSLFS